MKKYNLITASILSAGVMASSHVMADSSQCDSQDAHYQQCDNQLGWYLGADVGIAKTDVGRSDVERFFEQSQLDADVVDVDDQGNAWSAFIGYQFNTYFAIELGYLDLGDRSVDFTGQTADLDAFYDNVEHIYPQSAEGGTINVVASYPLSERFKVSGKLGYFDWRGDYQTRESGQGVGQDSVSDQDIWYGVELNYRVANNWQAYLGFSQVNLSRDDNEVFNLGIRYYFGGGKTHTVKQKSEPVVNEDKNSTNSVNSQSTLLKQPQPVKVLEQDTDNDGVFDHIDKCAQSDSRYQVDSDGCTLMQPQQASFNLVVRYANDSAEIAPSYFEKIAELAEFVNKYRVNSLTVTGHTSAPGSKAYNQTLSEQRAQSLAKILVEQYQIKPEIINTQGKGESDLLDTSNNEQAHQLNRRIELSLKEELLLPVKK
ncbi:OmpA family protein [Thalassotalea euphylliae]|uniref:OmpA family protein n=1 Tax=Thalassotalea euphylliae TaxID=1655234 RepID=A0A3E0TVZ1_9GAMM|nr:OmpA family protein [Thalassotalea euphylliae]REL28145.1 OmpA family protein [Thalassotalea euphylliae]